MAVGEGLDELEVIELEGVSKESKIALLEELGFGSDGEFVTKDGERWKDRYTDKDIPLDKMAIFPGREQGEVVIIEDSIFSLIHYMEEFEYDDIRVQTEDEGTDHTAR